MGRRNLTLSSSLPPGLPQNTPPKVGRIGTTQVDSASASRVATPQYTTGNQQQHRMPQSGSTSRHSPVELSPGGFNDSPQSNSFTSAQSELDDIIIDEILNMEEEQRKRDPQSSDTSKMPNSLSYADNLEALLTSGRSIGFQRQISNSAPTSTIDIEGLVREELMQEQEIMRDRRKKDIHNMIERRRRYNINDRIKELGMMLPKACTEDLKLNKGTILKASVEYIRALRRDQEKTHQVIQKFQNVEQDNKVMAMRIQELEQRLKQHGIPLPNPEVASTNYNNSMDRPIKMEPLDDDQTPQPRPDHPAPSFHTLTSSFQQPQLPHHHHHPSSLHQLPPLPHQTAASSHVASNSTAAQFGQPQSNRLLDFGMMSGHNYAAAISSDPQFSSFYTTPFGNDGVLETPPVVNNNLSLFGERRPPLGLVNHVNQHTRPGHPQHGNELMMDLSANHGNGGPSSSGVLGSTVGNLVSSSTAALISSSDPLMSDTRLTNSQLASPEVHWDSQAFSPEGERMDFMAQ